MVASNNTVVFQFGPDHQALLALGGGAWLLGMPNPVVYTIILALITGFVLRWTKFGRHLFAIGGTLREPLPSPIAASLAPAAAGLLRVQAELTSRCAGALNAGTAVSRNDVAGAHLAFTQTFSGLRQSGEMRALDFNAVGRTFGLAFTLDNLHRDLTDLADRIDEIATGIPERTATP